MPQSKYTRAPGPLPRIERIPRDAFRFDNQERRELVDLLPPRLQQLGIPENFKQEAAKLSGTPQLETLAELIVALTEECITSYPTARSLMGDARANPANSKAAIHKLRTALNPFVAGWVDYETATIIRGSLDRELADRERQLAGMRRPPANRRHLGFLCQMIGVFLKEFALANQVAFEERDAIRYVVTALDQAGIEHSYSTENPSRFAALVFPRS